MAWKLQEWQRVACVKTKLFDLQLLQPLSCYVDRPLAIWNLFSVDFGRKIRHARHPSELLAEVHKHPSKRCLRINLCKAWLTLPHALASKVHPIISCWRCLRLSRVRFPPAQRQSVDNWTMLFRRQVFRRPSLQGWARVF